MDARALANLLNENAVQKEATAPAQKISPSDLIEEMRIPNAAWHIAEDDKGRAQGFQWIAPHPDLPADTAEIASFVRLGGAGLEVGSSLFKVTCNAARSLKYSAIYAIIRADNTGGLAYYQSRGFETVKLINGIELDSGPIIDKVWKRYALRR